MWRGSRLTGTNWALRWGSRCLLHPLVLGCAHKHCLHLVHAVAVVSGIVQCVV
jgi:hypothetical protein